jgi:hypothetical protein
MSDDKRRSMAHGRTGNQRRSGVDTRSEEEKGRVGERRSKAERRTGKDSKANSVGKPKGT